MKADPIKTILNTIKRFDMIEKGQKVLVSVSGGPDSVFLFYALYKLKDTLGIEFSIANLDHGMRGKTSELDSEFVRHIAESFNIPFFHEKLVSSLYEKSKLSKEEIARKFRYEFLIASAKKKGIDAVATGHTVDDHAETILMRIVKGTTLRGVMGIPPVRYEDGVKIIRPLIETGKGEIIEFLRANSIPYRTDETNLEDAFFRNRVRNRLLPYLSQYNPRIKRALANLAENLREDFEFIEEERTRRTTPFYSDGGSLSLKLRDIVVQPKALRREVIKDGLSRAGANIKKLSYKHWKSVDDFIRLRQRGKSIDLPGGIRINKTRDSLTFLKIKKPFPKSSN